MAKDEQSGLAFDPENVGLEEVPAGVPTEDESPANVEAKGKATRMGEKLKDAVGGGIEKAKDIVSSDDDS